MIGTAIATALDAVGISKQRVEQWLGAPCNCEERQQKLDAVTYWALRVMRGKTQRAKEYLERIIR